MPKPLIDEQTYKDMYAQSLAEPEIFWAAQAEEFLNWKTSWTKVKDCSFAPNDVHIKWFEGGELNVAANCLDRHLKKRGDQPAIIWEPDDPSAKGRTLTYRELHKEVCRTANMLLKLGVTAKDVVTIYMPMVPEAAIAMLACARIGATHSVVFGGFSPSSIRGRLEDCQSTFIITADEGLRGGKKIPLKANVDEALYPAPVAGSKEMPQQVRHTKTLVLKHTGGDIAWNPERDVWWHELAGSVSDHHEAESFDAEHPLFILYTSGSTGKPKGVLHTSAGYLLWSAITFKYVFDYQPGDIYWCTADVGWITGHSYIVYGPLACGATTIMFEGVPTYPDAGRFWQIVDKYKVTQFYTAPTALRMLMREGDAPITKYSRKSLRVLGSVGEPINPEVWTWYRDAIGNGSAKVVDTWWQTETGGHLITPLPYAFEPKPGSATLPFFGVKPALLNAEQKVIDDAGEGALCMAESWPGQARTIYGDHQRFVETYFKPYPGYYFSGDAAARDADGYYWLQGRMDDVLNVSGHRLGTAEIESALVAHSAVTEAAVVGYPHDIKGEGIYAYVTLKPEFTGDDALRKELRDWMRKEISPIAAPDKLHFTPALPKTRSGKIMRRILRKIAAGDIQTKEDFSKLGDITTLLNPEAVEELVKGKV
ncbi:MAG: acetate--CoA ligase [Rickettsiales bacterium]